MECNMISTTGQTCVTRFKMIGNANRVEGSKWGWNTRLGFQKLSKMDSEGGCIGMYPVRNLSLKAFCGPFSLEKEFSTVAAAENISIDEESDSEGAESRLLSSNELKSLLADSERSKLIKKLSEANQHNRFLKRQMQVREDALINFKTELAGIELEMEALVALAEEITKTGIPEGSRKINGKYIQSHLLTRLEAIQERLEEQLRDVAAAQSKEVSLVWCGMAESVQVMGSFDGWSQGEHLSPEYNGSYTKFSTTLMLPPGRYEIKFLIDGEWQLSPEFPTIGEGLMENNLLVVE